MIPENPRQWILEQFEDREPVIFHSGDTIISRDSPPDHVGLITDGVVGMYIRGHEKFDPKATEALELILVLGEGQWINWAAHYEGQQGSEYRALSDVKIHLTNKDDPILKSPELLRYLHVDETSRFQQMLFRFSTAKTSLKWRLMTTLMCIRSCTDRPEFNLSLDDLASMCRGSKTNLVPLMKELEDEGLVEKGYKVYWIADRPAIEAACLALRNGHNGTTGD